MNFLELIEKNREIVLANKGEWEDRYATYAHKIANNKQKIIAAKALFHEWNPLYVYMSVNSAKSNLAFDLRFYGQSVANIIMKNNMLTLSVTADQKKNNETHFALSALADNPLSDARTKGAQVAWRSPEAKDFRGYFKQIQTEKSLSSRQEEHRLESAMLSALGKEVADDKILSNIQPVKIADVCRFQMPTPMSASDHQKGASYAKKGNGGGIDILARVGKGRGTQLCIMELKRASSKYSNSPGFPQRTMGQALAYAVFLQELLASSSGGQWYSIFGFKGPVPLNPTLKVCVVMPDNRNYSLINEQIPTNKGILDLRCVYLNEDWKSAIKVKRESLNTKMLLPFE